MSFASYREPPQQAVSSPFSAPNVRIEEIIKREPTMHFCSRLYYLRIDLSGKPKTIRFLFNYSTCSLRFCQSSWRSIMLFPVWISLILESSSSSTNIYFVIQGRNIKDIFVRTRRLRMLRHKCYYTNASWLLGCNILVNGPLREPRTSQRQVS